MRHYLLVFTEWFVVLQGQGREGWLSGVVERQRVRDVVEVPRLSRAACTVVRAIEAAREMIAKRALAAEPRIFAEAVEKWLG